MTSIAHRTSNPHWPTVYGSIQGWLEGTIMSLCMGKGNGGDRLYEAE